MLAPRYDILIVGGGPAGLAAAIHLRQRGPLEVLVLEARQTPQERIGETVPPDILLPLHRLDLLSRFRDDEHLPCPGSVSAWGQATPGYNDFVLNPMGSAWHLSREKFEVMLACKAMESGAAVRYGTRLVKARSAGKVFEVLLRDSGGACRTHAKWVVDATGASARCARSQGAKQLVHDRAIAVARFARLQEGSFPSQTILEATRDGWWYAARLPAGRVVTMFVTECNDVQRVTAHDYARWRQELESTQLLGAHINGCVFTDEKFHCIPILSSILDRIEGDRWLAIGDAASCYDPISSQGIYKALIDASDAAAYIASDLGVGKPVPWSYSTRVRNRYRDYIANRYFLYRREQRWADSPFWRRRQRIHFR